MIPADFFGGLPFGVCPFEKVENKLLHCRKLSEIPSGAESIIVVLFPYLLEQSRYEKLNISMYAVSKDYHIIAGRILTEAVSRIEKLYPRNSFAAFCDNSPIPEVYAAASAGLGCIGRNGLLINPVYGSYCFIGEIVTDLKLGATSDAPPAKCLDCGRCEAKCPTGAVTKSGIDASKCLSAVTQKKKDLTEEEILLIQRSGCAWGCDICQKVCPMNKGAKTTPIVEFKETARPEAAPGDDITDRAFAWRGKKVIERNLEIINKNLKGRE